MKLLIWIYVYPSLPHSFKSEKQVIPQKVMLVFIRARLPQIIKNDKWLS